MHEHRRLNHVLRLELVYGTHSQTEWIAFVVSSSPTLKTGLRLYHAVRVHQRLIQSGISDEVTRVL